MNKALSEILFVVSFLFLVGSQNVFAVTETVFQEDFDGVLVGWTESLCNESAPIEQICRIDQTTQLFDVPNEPAHSLPNWGFVEIEDSGTSGGDSAIPIEIRYQKSFNVVDEDDYDVSAWLGVKDCSGCNISTQLYIDGIIVLEKVGPDTPVPIPGHDFFEQATVHLTSGSHNVEMGMFSTGAVFGNFRASFDDILIEREVAEQVIGGEIIPIDATLLLLAGVQSTTWLIPVVLSVVVIGLFVVSRKSENS